MSCDLTTHPPAPSSAPSLASKLAIFASDIKISHTIFAMPFALLSTFMAAKVTYGGPPPIGIVILIIACMINARTVAMSANRLLDAKLDAANPRTSGRAIPGGRLSARFVVVILILCAIGFVVATSFFWLIYRNIWPLALALPVLVFLTAYPLLKRFTGLCHYYLGAALALAPLCAWLAVSGKLAWPPLIMGGAVLCWTAGFDIIYACQDYQSDLTTGVVSVPARVGIGRALWISRATHALSALFLVLLGLSTPLLGTLYFVGVAISIALLIVEHAIVRRDDLSKISVAFFTVNGLISLLLGTLGVLGLYL